MAQWEDDVVGDLRSREALAAAVHCGVYITACGNLVEVGAGDANLAIFTLSKIQ